MCLRCAPTFRNIWMQENRSPHQQFSCGGPGPLSLAHDGNTLYINNGDGTFRDASIEAGVTMGRWAWGTNFVDINNDGWEDLIVANGNITGRADDNGQNSGDL